MKYAYCVAISAGFGISGSVRQEYKLVAESDDEATEAAIAIARERFQGADLVVKEIYRGDKPLNLLTISL